MKMSNFFVFITLPSSTMEEETINRIILAIQTQLNPTTSSAQRQEAQQVIYQDLDQISTKSKRHNNALIFIFIFTRVN